MGEHEVVRSRNPPTPGVAPEGGDYLSIYPDSDSICIQCIL